MEIPLIKGRTFDAQDGDTSALVAVINKTMAEDLWGGTDPIGKRIKFPGSEKNPQPWRTIVGVVNDVSQYGLDKKPPMQIYLPHSQYPTAFNSLVVKTDADPKALLSSVRNEVLAVDQEQAVSNIRTLEELLSKSLSLRRFIMILLLAFAMLALLLAAVGIYGVMSYTVAQRTQEIGIRMALGARTLDVLKLVVGQSVKVAILGVAIGLLAAAALTVLLESLLFGVGAHDTLTFSFVTLLLLGVALLACFVPARRAAKTDPILALRYE
jgi:putative ABC transport system permease protein